MIASEFDYEAPKDIGRAIAILKGAPEGKVIAGGMTLVPMLNLGLLSPELIISLRKMPELTGVRELSDTIVIGAMTRHHTIALDPLILRFAPLLALAARQIGDTQVRNRGTLGGSLAHADPAANYLPAVVALDATLELAGPSGRRTVHVREFFIDVMTTALERDELIVNLSVPKRNASTQYGFRKFTRVKGNFPVVCVGSYWNSEADAGAIVVGGVTPTPMFIPLTSSGVRPDEIGDLIRRSILNPLEDANGDAEYKRELAVIIGCRALADARVNQ